MAYIESLSWHQRSFSALQLMRPANIITAWADILAGVAIVGTAWNQPELPMLILATTGLYGGGVVLNDVFDAKLDAIERPERPIPSGRISRQLGGILGAGLLAIGIGSAAIVSPLSAGLAAAIALCAIFYDAIAKHTGLLGPICMGACRGGNLLLGMSITGMIPATYAVLAIIPILYIMAITTIAQGEVSGGSWHSGAIALSLIAIVLGILSYFSWQAQVGMTWIPFELLFMGLVIPSFVKAMRFPTARQIRIAVKTGVINLIALDSAIAAGFTDWTDSLLILILLPLSLWLARLFAVT